MSLNPVLAKPQIDFLQAQSVGNGKYELVHAASSVDPWSEPVSPAEMRSKVRTEVSKLKKQQMSCSKNQNLLLTSGHFVCYAVREGGIRVIQPQRKDNFKLTKSTKTEHTSLLLNPSCVEMDTTLLYWLDGDANMGIFTLRYPPAPGVPVEEAFLKAPPIELFFLPSDGVKQVACHPKDPKYFVTVHQESIVFWNVDKVLSSGLCAEQDGILKCSIGDVEACNAVRTPVISDSGAPLVFKDAAWLTDGSQFVLLTSECAFIFRCHLPDEDHLQCIQTLEPPMDAVHGLRSVRALNDLLILATKRGILAYAVETEGEQRIGALVQCIGIMNASNSDTDMRLDVDSGEHETLTIAVGQNACILVLAKSAGWRASSPALPFPLLQRLKLEEPAHQLATWCGISPQHGVRITQFYNAFNFTREKDGIPAADIIMNSTDRVVRPEPKPRLPERRSLPFSQPKPWISKPAAGETVRVGGDGGAEGAQGLVTTDQPQDGDEAADAASLPTTRPEAARAEVSPPASSQDNDLGDPADRGSPVRDRQDEGLDGTAGGVGEPGAAASAPPPPSSPPPPPPSAAVEGAGVAALPKFVPPALAPPGLDPPGLEPPVQGHAATAALHVVLATQQQAALALPQALRPEAQQSSQMLLEAPLSSESPATDQAVVAPRYGLDVEVAGETDALEAGDPVPGEGDAFGPGESGSPVGSGDEANTSLHQKGEAEEDDPKESLDWGFVKRLAASFVKGLNKRQSDMSDRIVKEVAEICCVALSGSASDLVLLEQARVKITEARDAHVSGEKKLSEAVRNFADNWAETNSVVVAKLLQKELGKILDGVASSLAQSLAQSRKFCEALARGVQKSGGAATKTALEALRPPKMLQDSVSKAMVEALHESMAPVFKTELRIHFETELAPLLGDKINDMMTVLRDKMRECFDEVASEHEDAARRLATGLSPVVQEELRHVERAVKERLEREGGASANTIADTQLEELSLAMQREVVQPLHARIRELSSQVQKLREDARNLEKRWKDHALASASGTHGGCQRDGDVKGSEEAQMEDLERQFRDGSIEEAFTKALQIQAQASRVDYLGGLFKLAPSPVETWLNLDEPAHSPLTMQVKMQLMLSLARQLESDTLRLPDAARADKIDLIYNLWLGCDPCDPQVTAEAPGVCKQLLEVLQRVQSFVDKDTKLTIGRIRNSVTMFARYLEKKS